MSLLYKKDNNNTKLPLRIITLGGTESVTQNITLYECGDEILVVDCGVGFPDEDMHGVDMVVPDFTYLKENKDKVKALILTHGHEDHIGSVPFLLDEINVPIYGCKIVQGFVHDRVEDRNKKKLENLSMHLIDADTEELRIGNNFKIKAFNVNHSVPNTLGFAITTPQGVVLHMADYKVDWTPILDKPIELGKIAEYGDKGVLCLLSDCLGADVEGYSKSEKSLSHTFDDLMEKAAGRQLLITTISSNISRMYQIIASAVKYHRYVVFTGRSIQQNSDVARSLGYLDFPDDVFIDEKEAANYVPSELVYIIAGCYGQQGSGLDRVARGEHKQIFLENNALVIFSADPNPPGVAVAVNKLQDTLTLAGAEVLYSGIQDNIHVSGHGPKGDLTIVACAARPKYFMPIGGTIVKMRAYANMVEELGFDRNNVFQLLKGECIVFENDYAKKGERLDLKEVYVDGNMGVGTAVIKDREVLSNDGVFIILVPFDVEKNTFGAVDVISRGFVYVKENKELIGQAKDVVNKLIDPIRTTPDEWNNTKPKIEKELGRFLFKVTGRNPLILVHNLRV